MALFKEYSYKKGALVSVGSTFVWKLLSFINSILIAFYFGTQARADIYFYIIQIAGIGAVFFTSLNGNVLIPQAMFLSKQNEESARSFINFFLLSYIILIAIILAVGFLFPVNIFGLFSKFSQEILTKDILILQLAFLYFCLHVFCYFLLDIMYMYRIFSVNFLLPLNAVVPMIALVLFHNTLGIKTMLCGFIGSYILQVCVYFYLMKKKLNWSFSSFKISFEKRFNYNILTNQLLVIGNFAIGMVPMALISGFGGMISAHSYAKQLTDAPSEILTNKITSVFHIQLNENAAAQNFEDLNHNYLKANYLILFIMVPLAIFTCYFAPDIVNLFFKRGEFNAQSSTNVVKFLRPMMILLITTVLTPFAGSIIASTRKIKESFKYMIFRDIIIVGALYFFISRFGPFAYPYTQLGCSIFGYFIVALFFKNHIPQIKFWQPLKDAGLLVFLNLLALIPSAFLAQVLTGQAVFIRIFLCGLLFLFTLALLYLPTGQLKKILSFVLGMQYQNFCAKLPQPLKKFFI
ncbi:MAG: oligosaccharide flippase family protein [Elusimicrobiaceae bacterium]|nr:oligosaccharide flippase family protein [Elusimicrobiaceae bacterium]